MRLPVLLVLCCALWSLVSSQPPPKPVDTSVFISSCVGCPQALSSNSPEAQLVAQFAARKISGKNKLLSIEILSASQGILPDQSENFDLLLRLGHKKTVRIVTAVVHVQKTLPVEEGQAIQSSYTLTEWGQIGRFAVDDLGGFASCEGCSTELDTDNEHVRLIAYHVWRHIHHDQGHNRLIDTRHGQNVKILFAQSQNMVMGVNTQVIIEGEYQGKLVQVNAVVHQNMKLKLQVGPFKMKNMLPRLPEPEPEDESSEEIVKKEKSSSKDEL